MQVLSSSSSIRVALVEDDAYFQHAFQDAIAQAPDMALQSVSGTLAHGLAQLEQGAPDVLLVDIGLPDGSGIELIRTAHARYPACNVMVCTTFGDEAHVMQSLEAGASGYLLKDSAAGRIVDEIRSLHGGGSPISPLIARQVLMRFRGVPTAPVVESELPATPSPSSPSSPSAAAGASPDQPGAAAKAGLSARETQVLEYITRGFTADEIAGLMQLSRHTVLTFIRRIYIKLEVNSKAEAIFEARSRGLVKE